MSRFEFDIDHRDEVILTDDSWPGDHEITGPNDLCGPPEDKRTVTRGERETDFNDEWIYRCVPGGDLSKAHIMTSIGDTAGYSIGAFSPAQVFNDVSEIRWDVNITDLGGRQWIEVALIPAAVFDFQYLPCQGWLPCNSSTYDELGAVGFGWTGNNAEVARILTPEFPNGDEWDVYDSQNAPCSTTSGYCFGVGWGGDGMQGSEEARNSVAIRRTNIVRDNGDGTLTWSIEQADGSFYDLTHPTSFPDGPVRVVFKDHNYTPTKSQSPDITFTWHWDNITIIE
jgi:hypothetical protein